nr:PREDICTED: RNA pseudouridylate synthase domain-containing protein 1-like isoform X2 [Megachile rotundata]
MYTKFKNNIDILYHSENFIVVSKPYDMCINSNNPEKKDTLQFELKRVLPNLANPNLFHEFHFVHRLDYATSGVICIALNKKAARAASNAFETRTAKKFYLALLHGHINESYIIIDKAIGIDIREKKGNHKMCVSGNAFCEKPRKSYTVLVVLERGFRNGKPATKVLLCPATGRRHQLRVHCSHIGHTVIGDYTYSERKDIEPYRTFLHSFRYVCTYRLYIRSYYQFIFLYLSRLILSNQIENLDVKSTDPFQASDPRNQWLPTNIARVLDENIFSDIDDLMQ